MAGDWTVLSGQTLNVNPSSSKGIYGSLTNQGTVNATDNLQFFNGGAVTNNALYNVQGDFGLVNAGYGGAFVNNGTFRKSSGTGTTSVGTGVSFSNTATGKIVVDTGTVSLGQAFANLGTLDFGISGLTDYGVLSVGNAATLGGLLQVHLMGGYTPQVGDSFDVMTFTSETGVFANSNWTFDGVTYNPVYASTKLTLQVTNVVAVPEPETWAMLLAGLALVGMASRQRKI
jgi:hypothetical protein